MFVSMSLYFILRQSIVLPIKNGIVLNSEYLWKVMTVILTLRLGNPSLLQFMCKNEHAYTLTFGLHPEASLLYFLGRKQNTTNHINISLRERLRTHKVFTKY